MGKEIRKKAEELTDTQLGAATGGGKLNAGPFMCTCSKCNDYDFGIYFNKCLNNGCPNYHSDGTTDLHYCNDCSNFSK